MVASPDSSQYRLRMRCGATRWGANGWKRGSCLRQHLSIPNHRCAEAAFEEAWASLGPTLAPDWIDNIRISLAHAILAHAGMGEIDYDRLKISAIEAVQNNPLGCITSRLSQFLKQRSRSPFTRFRVAEAGSPQCCVGLIASRNRSPG
jgi:hypothetical protein